MAAQNNGTKKRKDRDNPIQHGVNTIEELESMREFLAGDEIYAHDDGKEVGPFLLWRPSHSKMMDQFDDLRSDWKLPDVEDAREVVARPMRWYAQAAIERSIREHGGKEPQGPEDLEPFPAQSGAFSGLDAVIMQVRRSTQWAQGAALLAMCLEETTKLLDVANDVDGHAIAQFNSLVGETKAYMHSVAAHADMASAEQALNSIVQVCCTQEFMPNMGALVELLSCCLSYMQWEDRRIFGYDAIEQVRRYVHHFAAERGVFDEGAPAAPLADEPWPDLRIYDGDDDEALDQAMDAYERIGAKLAPLRQPMACPSCGDEHRFTEHTPALAFAVWVRFHSLMRYVRHDVARLGGENAKADAFIMEGRFEEPYAEAYAAQLMKAERWEELLDFVDKVETYHDWGVQDPQFLFDQSLVPYGWDSLREIAWQALGNRRQLMKMYRERVVEATSYNRFSYRSLQQLYGLRSGSWNAQVDMIVRDYNDGTGRPYRNKLYEFLMHEEGMSREAARYVLNFPAAEASLKGTILGQYDPDWQPDPEDDMPDDPMAFLKQMLQGDGMEPDDLY